MQMLGAKQGGQGQQQGQPQQQRPQQTQGQPQQQRPQQTQNQQRQQQSAPPVYEEGGWGNKMRTSPSPGLACSIPRCFIACKQHHLTPRSSGRYFFGERDEGTKYRSAGVTQRHPL